MERLIEPATIAPMATKSSHSSDAAPRRRRAAAGDQPQAVPHLSVGERVARGKAARQEVPRSLHAHFEPSDVRADPVELLERQAETRVTELVPIRYGRMLVSPFTFYRGAAMIMAHDLAATPRSGLMVQCCGDAHLSNFGAFASPERRLVFDINDFDETLPGPWEWDVKRLAVSMLVAAADNGYGAKDRDKIVLETVGAYRSAVREFAGMSNLEVWYSHLDFEAVLQQYAPQFKARVASRAEKAVAKARTRDSMSAFKKLTEVVDGKVQIVDQSPLIVPIEKLAAGEDIDAVFDELRMLIRVYRESLEFDRRVLIEEFHLQDFARKVVGVGSVGTRAWIMLMLGRDGDDPLFLQLKEARESVLEPFLGASGFANHGERVVEGQRLTQAASDILLGWIRITDLDGLPRDFYVRQLWDAKGSAVVETMNPVAMTLYASSAAGRSRRRTPAPVMRSRSEAISAEARPSTGHWRRSRRPTPTRTSVTTARSGTRSRRGASERNPVCDVGLGRGGVRPGRRRSGRDRPTRPPARLRVDAAAVGGRGDRAHGRGDRRAGADERASRRPLAAALYWGWMIAGSTAVGLYWWLRRPPSRFGPLLVGFGVLAWVVSWQASDWPPAFVVGVLAEGPAFLLRYYLFLAFPMGRLEPPAARWLMGGLWIVLLGFFLPWALFSPVIAGPGG
jgi:hypothetical protein